MSGEQEFQWFSVEERGLPVVGRLEYWVYSPTLGVTLAQRLMRTETPEYKTALSDYECTKNFWKRDACAKRLNRLEPIDTWYTSSYGGRIVKDVTYYAPFGGPHPPGPPTG